MAIIKPIKLTEKDKDKLVEMSNHYFPKFKWFFWLTEDDELPIDYNSIGMFGHCAQHTVGEKKHYPALEIHWYEFMVHYLSPKMGNTMINARNSQYDIKALYSQYKRETRK